MTYEDKALEYIAQPENLAIAIEIAEHVEKLRDDLHRRFWPLFNDLFSNRLANSEHSERWLYSPFPIRRIKSEWEKSFLRYNHAKSKERTTLQLSFAQGTHDNHYKLFRGVLWTMGPSELSQSFHSELRKKLSEKNLTIVEGRWLGLNWYTEALEGADFMLKLYHTPEQAVSGLVDDYWQLFVELQPLLEPINLALLE